MKLLQAALLSGLLGIAFLPSLKAAKDEAVPLSMPKIDSTLQAFTNLGELLDSDPKLAKQWKDASKRSENEADTKDGSKEDDHALERVINQMRSKDDRIGAAFDKASTTPKDASLVMMTLIASAMGDAMLQGKPIPSDMKPELADNIRFYRQHKDQLMASFKKLQDLTTKLDKKSEYFSLIAAALLSSG